jgi:hypothetical protein
MRVEDDLTQQATFLSRRSDSEPLNHAGVCQS